MKKEDNQFVKTEKLLKKQNHEIEGLLSQQTIIILNAVEKKIEKTEEKINKKFDKLINTLDVFLKRLTDTEDEFVIMKAEINKMKEIIKEKLGVEVLI